MLKIVKVINESGTYSIVVVVVVVVLKAVTQANLCELKKNDEIFYQNNDFKKLLFRLIQFETKASFRLSNRDRDFFVFGHRQVAVGKVDYLTGA
ncbi:hypothetical protein BpHYR1_030178 [Brachionus plicatilis]|uniref:Uncharacterized protein n=1 Tax=Brachionus plicatilis TaxID=10195 RepID=A0A3M7RG27_BRAPC|nr:hypothetical protein BpHYR1_030178 [Brachionus plicatilis]